MFPRHRLCPQIRTLTLPHPPPNAPSPLSQPYHGSAGILRSNLVSFERGRGRRELPPSVTRASYHWFLDDAPPRREVDVRQTRVLNAFRYIVGVVLRVHSATDRTYIVIFTHRAALHFIPDRGKLC